MKRKLRAFFARLRRGQVILPLYLAYYYIYLSLYDLRHATKFSNSQTPEEIGNPAGGTGNFPSHPRLVVRFLKAAALSRDEPIIDVGHGSGAVLFAASNAGYTNLTGIEYGQYPYDLSVNNLGARAKLIHGDALEVDLTPYKAVTFYSPFRGELASRFFNRLPQEIETVLTVNHDREAVEPVLNKKGYRVVWSYQHPLYPPFNAKVWKR